MDKYVVIVSALTGSVDKCLRIVEGTDMIPIQIRIKDFNMPEGASALVYAKTRGMAARVQTATIDGNAIEFTPEKGFFTEGENVIQGRITKNGRDLVTFAITVVCTRSIVTDDAEEMNSDPTLLQQLLSEIEVISARTSTLASLKEGSTTGDAELIDARVDKNGNAHDNVGEHIREVTSQLSSEIEELFEDSMFATKYTNNDTTFIKNGFLNEVLEHSTSSNYVYLDKIPVIPNGTIEITGKVGINDNSSPIYVFSDSDGNYIKSTAYTERKMIDYEKEIVSVPDNALFVSVVFRIATNPLFSVYVKRKYIQEMYYKTCGYATPEMYGAKGDGITDDSEALTQAFLENEIVVLSKKYYVGNTTFDITHNIDILGNGIGTIITEPSETEKHLFKALKKEINVMFSGVVAKSRRAYRPYIEVTLGNEPTNTLASNVIFVHARRTKDQEDVNTPSKIFIKDCRFIEMSVAYSDQPNTKIFIKNCVSEWCEMFVWANESFIVSQGNYIETSKSGVGMGSHYHIYYCTTGSKVYSYCNTIICDKLYHDIYHPLVSAGHSEDENYKYITEVYAYGDYIEGYLDMLGFGNFANIHLNNITFINKQVGNKLLIKGTTAGAELGCKIVLNGCFIDTKSWAANSEGPLYYENCNITVDMSNYPWGFVFGDNMNFNGCIMNITKDCMFMKGSPIIKHSSINVDGEPVIFSQNVNGNSPKIIFCTISANNTNKYPNSDDDKRVTDASNIIFANNVCELSMELFDENITLPNSVVGNLYI